VRKPSRAAGKELWLTLERKQEAMRENALHYATKLKKAQPTLQIANTGRN
jgi:hypothetical protein